MRVDSRRRSGFSGRHSSEIFFVFFLPNWGARVIGTGFSSNVKCSCDSTERHRKTYVMGCICKIGLWCDFQITNILLTELTQDWISILQTFTWYNFVDSRHKHVLGTAINSCDLVVKEKEFDSNLPCLSYYKTHTFWALSQNWEKRLIVSSCLSVRPSIRIEKTRSPLHKFSWNFAFEHFSKIRRDNSRFITIGQL
jgi:hypothetical protein